MWAVKNQTPYKAERTWMRNKKGVHVWIVAVKATYDIKPDGKVKLAEEQLDPLLAPEYVDKPGLSSLAYDMDLVMEKPTTDILLNGTAYAPGGQPSTDFIVSMQVDKIYKPIRVRGDRWWKKWWFKTYVTKPKPVTEVPLMYERAYGGYFCDHENPRRHRLDTRNPVGLGVFGRFEDREGRPLWNFEYPGGRVRKNGAAGFGALDYSWFPRREYQGTYDQNWMDTRHPLLPKDWNPRCLNCSPTDQQPETHLKGGEPVDLVNLTPSGHLRFELPKVSLSFTTHIAKRKEEHGAKLSSVIIEPDYPRLIMVWSTMLTVPREADYLTETVVKEKGCC